MQTNDWVQLIQRLTEGGARPAEEAAVLLQGLATPDSPAAQDVQRLAKAEPHGQPAVSPPASASSTGATSEGDSTAASVMKTIGMVTGFGPMVTGLVKLFGGGGGGQDAVPELTPYALPQRISVEAGLAGDGSFVPVAYSQSGSSRPAAERAQPANPATQIHVNVQAMDSRSFLDHSDEIARAVRDAMLRSHSLNDVVSEL